MHISQRGIDLIKKWEGGVLLKAYKCPAGVWTIGIGHTGKDVKQGTTITNEKAMELFKKDIQRFEKIVDRYQEKYNWNQNEYDALVSFCFNCGDLIESLTAKSTRTKSQIAEKLLLYCNANGKRLAGLYNRRLDESRLFKEAPTKQSKNQKIVEVNAKSGLNLRKKPSMNGVVYKAVPKNTRLVLIETLGEWSKIKYNDLTLYCYSKYISEVI